MIMPQIEMYGQIYAYKTCVNDQILTITNIKTRRWARWSDDENIVNDPDFYEGWDDWIIQNWDTLDWNE